MRENTQGQCPEDKLKFYSYIEDLRTSRRQQEPLTPHKQSKGWIVDAWDPPNLDLPLPKTDPRPLKQPTPLRSCSKGFVSPSKQVGQSRPLAPISTQKENKEGPIPQIRSSRRSRMGEGGKEEQEGPFKMVLASVVYPVVRSQKRGSQRRRIDRFHSFMTRTVRR